MTELTQASQYPGAYPRRAQFTSLFGYRLPVVVVRRVESGKNTRGQVTYTTVRLPLQNAYALIPFGGGMSSGSTVEPSFDSLGRVVALYWLCYPLGFDVNSADRVEVNSVQYEVVGDPQEAVHPRFSRQFGGRVLVRRVYDNGTV